MIDKTDKAMNAILNLKEEFVTFMILTISLVIIGIMIIYFIYLKNLPSTECKFMDKLYGKIDGNLRSINVNDPDCSGNLYDYYIKTAYNACSGGNYKNDWVNICNVKNVLKQGVRCLDFELYSIGDLPVVSTSTVDSVYVKETFNYVKFSDVMTTINSHAFSGGDCPNPNDPLIIHLRCMSNNQKMYQNLAELFKSYDPIMLGSAYSYENHGQNLGALPLLNFQKKVILIIDKTNDSFLQNNDLLEYVNTVSNSFFMRGYQYNKLLDVHGYDEITEYNKRNMTIVYPDQTSDPANPSGILTREIGCQMVAMRYQHVDNFLENNNTFFDNAGYAFCLKPENLRYQLTLVDDPTPQNPEYSYATKTQSTDYYTINY